MTTVSAPFGLRPSRPSRGGTAARQEAMSIASTYGTKVSTQDPVKLAAGGTLELAAAGETMCGVFGGVEYTDSSGEYQIKAQWPASTTLASGTTSIAYLWRDPDIEYWIQSGGSVVAASLGDQADHVAGTANDLTGCSGAYLSTTLAGAGAQAGFRIVGVADLPNNAWADTYTIVRVMINEMQGLVLPNTTAI